MYAVFLDMFNTILVWAMIFVGATGTTPGAGGVTKPLPGAGFWGIQA